MTNWPTKKLGEVLDYEQPGKYIVNSKNYSNDYKTPVLTAGKTFILGNTDEKENIFTANKLPVIIFDDFTTAIKFVDFPFKVKSSAMKILHAKKNIADVKYVFYAMQTTEVNNAKHKRYWISEYSNLQIPLQPVEEQRKIVVKLEKVLGKITEAKRLRAESETAAQNLLPAELHRIFTQHNTPHKQHTNKPENGGMSSKWEEKELGEVVNIEAKKNTKSLPYVGMEDIESGTGKFIGSKEKRAVRSTTSHFTADHILYGKLRPYLNKFLVPDFEGHCTTEFLPLRPDTRFLTREWLAVWLRHNETVDNIMATTTGSRMPRANMNLVKKFKIPLPPLAEQRKIVARLDFLSEKIRRLQEYQKSTASDFISLEQSILSKSFQ